MIRNHKYNVRSLLKELELEWKSAYSRNSASHRKESANKWIHAGTRHSALCELNYTPEKPDEAIDISKFG
ncbi:malate:quinone oxidoreductase [Sporolactobacillus shoreicorticis]|uniref:malate dehydrogenase (quinone) n=1 Tax=Sporolactobacillus shoreicorticis TaxID=1923877 RepID=A0ABW5S0N2_9BACL|nr:malate:quinone oxidoreductase [Sporolactobacillus shoreicorticis]MCO7127515.1 malate:quinone oxidoreductase [Sporolactobacillus shoreicorticis]